MTTAFLCESPSALSESELRNRFVYWRGASDKRYLHTVYPPSQLPEVDLGVVLLVRHIEGKRRVVRVVVTTASQADGRALLAAMAEECAADEIHIHALARSEGEARDVARDLTRAVALDQARAEAPRRGRGRN